MEWSKNGGGWSTGSTTVVSSDTMNLRLDASANYLTAVTAIMTVGSGGQAVLDTYAVTTIPNPAAVDNKTQASVNKTSNSGITGNING